jgi:predicted dehydrogenase
MVEAARRHNRVVQMGSQWRSSKHIQEAADFVKSGTLGKVSMVRGWAWLDWQPDIGRPAEGNPPAGADYDLWLGPAPKRPFNPNRFHYNFRWFWDYAGGLMTDWGVHMIDMVHAAMGDAGPRHVMASGGKSAYPDDASETPDTMQASFEFDGYSMLWEHATGIDLGPYGRDHGVAFIGNRGTVVVDRGKWEVLAETEDIAGGISYLTTPVPPRARRGEAGLDLHLADFVRCIGSREQPRCNAAVAARAAVTAHLGNIAFRTGRRLTWDDAARTFPGDAEANALLVPTYRAPWSLPSL